MKRLVDWVQGFALAWGGPGLFLIGFLDSSFLSVPEANDLLVIWMVTRHKPLMLYYVLMATAGSVLGCLVLYLIAKKGGEAFLRKRFKEHHVEGGLKLFQKYGLLAVAIPALLPPPAPFKLFVLLAGVAEVRLWQFVAAVGGARFLRYFLEGLLALYYGDQAAAYLRDHAAQVSMWVGGAAVAAVIAYVVWNRRRRASGSAV
jgi:membrane protein YqaA with SNARE-associated domain